MSLAYLPPATVHTPWTWDLGYPLDIPAPLGYPTLLVTSGGDTGPLPPQVTSSGGN